MPSFTFSFDRTTNLAASDKDVRSGLCIFDRYGDNGRFTTPFICQRKKWLLSLAKEFLLKSTLSYQNH